MHLTENDPVGIFSVPDRAGMMVPAMQQTQDPQESLLIESEDCSTEPAAGTRYRVFWQVLVDGNWQERSEVITSIGERDHFVGVLNELTAGGYARDVAVAEFLA